MLDFRNVRDHYNNFHPGRMAVYKTYKLKDDVYLGYVETFLAADAGFTAYDPNGQKVGWSMSRNAAGKKLLVRK